MVPIVPAGVNFEERKWRIAVTSNPELDEGSFFKSPDGLTPTSSKKRRIVDVCESVEREHHLPAGRFGPARRVSVGGNAVRTAGERIQPDVMEAPAFGGLT